VCLTVPPIRGMRRFKVKVRYPPHFIGPFRIFRRVGEMAYQLELPDHLSYVHDVFHVSQLKKCLRVTKEQLPMEELSVQGDTTYTEYPIKIIDTLTRVTRNKVIKMYKVQWSYHGEDEANLDLCSRFIGPFRIFGVQWSHTGWICNTQVVNNKKRIDLPYMFCLYLLAHVNNHI
jgi:hypothetical protein